MIEKLIEVISTLGTRVSAVVEIKEGEGGVILRRGKYLRTVEPGWHFKIPVVDHLVDTETCLTTLRVGPQSKQ
jgi:regulator of protease activity HflC (stomatin/prohibitin superfamily)